MDTKLNYILVGLFVLVLGAALVIGIVWLARGEIHGRYDTYIMYTGESVTGLRVDAPVRYRGVAVGRVSEIGLANGDPTRVRIELEIVDGTPVKTDTVATLEMQGLTGLKNINLTGGTAEAPALVGSDGEPPVIPSRASLLSQLDDRATVVIDKLAETSDRINRLLSDRNTETITRMVEHLEDVTAALSMQSDTINKALMELRSGAQNVRLASEGVPDLVGQLRTTAESFDTMAKELSAAGVSVREEVRGSGEQMRRFVGETVPEAGALIDELREAAANLRRASEAIERDPSVMLFGAGAPTPGPGE